MKESAIKFIQKMISKSEMSLFHKSFQDDSITVKNLEKKITMLYYILKALEDYAPNENEDLSIYL